MNQDKQIELFYSFSRDVEESRDLLEGYRSDIDQLVSGYTCLRAWRSKCFTRKICLPTSSFCCWLPLS